MERQKEPVVLAAVRRALLAILLIGVVGTLVELLLLEHTEGFWQQFPLYLLGTGLIVVVWHVTHRGPAGIRMLQVVMTVFVLSGVIGVLLHYQGNVEFELELHAAARGVGLFWESIKGATPTLAPGSMIQLGLLGLAYTYRHPALAAPAKRSNEPGSNRQAEAEN